MTKEAILHKSLYLFSQKGYSATSIREIAAAVGIKESSIYAHFSGKEDIFRSVIAKYDFCQAILTNLEELKNNPLDVLRYKTEQFISAYANPDYIAYSKLSEMEMLKDGPARELVRAESFDKIDQFFESMLTMLVDDGILKQCDKKLMLVEFVGPFYYIHMKLISGWLRDGEPEILIDTMRKHLQHFFESFKDSK